MHDSYRQRIKSIRILSASLALAALATECESFLFVSHLRKLKLIGVSSSSALHYEKDNYNSGGGDNNNNWRDSFDLQTLNIRLKELKVKNLEEEIRRPPNADLSPTEFVKEVLKGLWDNSEPLPDSGFRLLLRASTPYWRQVLYQSVGAPKWAHEEVVASALGEAMARPHNQFGILVGEGEKFVATFPTDTIDYSDGTCWLECQFRDATDNKLLVVTGWQLQQRRSDGAWMVDRIDWQDFRDEFRPGIGREEWMRICG